MRQEQATREKIRTGEGPHNANPVEMWKIGEGLEVAGSGMRQARAGYYVRTFSFNAWHGRVGLDLDAATTLFEKWTVKPKQESI